MHFKHCFGSAMIIMALFFSLFSQAQDSRYDSILNQSLWVQDTSAIADTLFSILNNEFDEYSTSGYDSRRITVAEDGSVVCFQFIGEGCGAYCNPMYETLIFTADEVRLIPIPQLPSYFGFVVDTIILIDSEKSHYLFFGRTHGRARSIEAVWGKEASLLEIANNKIIELWTFQSITSNLASDNDRGLAELDYQPKTRTITYLYDWYVEYPDFQFIRKQGTWRYNGSTFIEEDKSLAD